MVLQAWADVHADSILPLMTVVLDGLQLWPYTLGLLGNMVVVPSLKTAALLHCPTLLHDLLDKADRSQRGFDEVSELCILLMSESLPPSTALPASAQAFFVRLFDHAVRSPRIETVEPVYSLLRGACGELLEILPQSNLDDFREHLTRMMKTKSSSMDDQLLGLYCLAIIARINRQHIDPLTFAARETLTANSQFPSSQIASSRTREEVQKFFCGEWASKRTMPMLALQVVYACRGDHVVSQSTTMKPVQLAREIVLAIEPSARHAFTRSDPKIMQKLHEKIMRTPLYHAVQFEVCNNVPIRACGIDNMGYRHFAFSAHYVKSRAFLQEL